MKISYSHTIIVELSRYIPITDTTVKSKKELLTNDPEGKLAWIKAKRPNYKVLQVIDDPVTVEEFNL